MPFLRIFLISILFINTLTDIPSDRSVFIAPVKIPLSLSANFGELRIDHFHSGIDIKTQGVTGKEVVAAADGYVYRISVSPGGFGNALYLRHPSGYSTVYGHLDRFIPMIEKYVNDYQYERKSYLVSIFPPKDKFPVNQGDLIAYSGNTGSSSGPHLHYEVRRSDSEIPVNPLFFEFGTGDDIAPVFERLAIYPVNRKTLINNFNSVKKINVAGGYGNYHIPAENEIRISGNAGFGIKAFDLLNDSYNRFAVYSIELKIDSITIYNYVMDEFSFSESRYINSHIDYEACLREKAYYERTYILPNDKLSTYRETINRGIYNFSDNKNHQVEINISDVHNNRSSLTFKVTSVPPGSQPFPDPASKGLITMPYNRSNRFRAENITVSIPAGALYDTLLFTYRRDPGTLEMLSDAHCIHDKYTPVHKAYTLSIKPTRIPEGKESKLLIVQIGDDFSRSPLASTFSDGFVNAEALAFGVFYVGIDTVAPVISPNGLVSGSDLSSRSELRVKITDELSGIKSYEPVVDGKWALFEYDQKNNVLVYRFDSARITQGSEHSLTLKVTDNMDNQSRWDYDFKW
jgi:hypothetical protein